MIALRNLKLRLAREQDGVALVTVIAVTAVIASLVVAGIAFSIGALRQSHNDQDWNGALAAAYAAVEEYQTQLTNDASYVQYGNPASSFSQYDDPNVSCTGGVKLPPTDNPAFGLGATGSWATVAGSDGAAQYRYEVNNHGYYCNGVIKIQATGKVGDAVRSLYAELKQSGFVDYVYFTNYETIDPFNTSSSCYAYAYAGRPTTCQNIQFGAADVIDGAVHSNDRIVIECGATFKSPITTGYNPSGGLRYAKATTDTGTCTPNFFQGLQPNYGGVIEMPPTNSQMKKEVRSDLPTEVPNPGCLYTGPTTITFTNDGYMTVVSPWTKKTQISATGGTAPAICGTPGTAVGQLGHSSGQKVKVPDNNVIFVQNVPGVSGDPNYAASTDYFPGSTTANRCRGTDNKNPVGYPVTNETAPANAYGCRNGDVFVKGTLEGKVTLAAENNIYVVDDLKYDDEDRDVLGLVGQNAVYVWNPVRNRSANKVSNTYYTGTCVAQSCSDNVTIHAAILSVQHTFMVQNNDVRIDGGDFQGKLTVKGSIAQMFRGVVRWYSGFDKSYEYDKRFKYTSPPRFLAPTSTTYGVSTWVEINPVFAADGAYQ